VVLDVDEMAGGVKAGVRSCESDGEGV
jgi:hypothetical protein